jgi:hypothetical protein
LKLLKFCRRKKQKIEGSEKRKRESDEKKKNWKGKTR